MQGIAATAFTVMKYKGSKFIIFFIIKEILILKIC